jgi:hypothetical protein
MDPREETQQSQPPRTPVRLRDLERNGPEEEAPERFAARTRWPLVLIGMAVIFAGGSYLLIRDAEVPELQPAAPVAPVAERPAPPPKDADAQARDTLSALSTLPRWAEWLGVDGVARRFAFAVANIAEGETPREHLGFLAPTGRFRATARGGRETISRESYARYDFLADVVASIDARAAATAFTRLEPILDGYYAEVGRPGQRFRDAAAQAVRRLLAVPVIEGDLRVDARPIVYKYVDPRLENLSDAEKHLLRMGPRNVKLIQGKLREIAAALQLNAG